MTVKEPDSVIVESIIDVPFLSFLTVDQALEIIHDSGWTNIGRVAFCELLKKYADSLGCMWYKDEKGSHHYYISEAALRRWIKRHFTIKQIPKFKEPTEEVS